MESQAEFQRLQTEGKALQKTFALTEPQDVSSKYGQFLKNYNDAGERIFNTPAAASGGSNSVPFVVVLIDGRSHKVRASLLCYPLYILTCQQFRNELYCNKAGGHEMAKRFRVVTRDQIALLLPALARGSYHLIVKIIASLKTLSSIAAAEKLTHNGPRALAPYFAAFTGVSPHYDFVDVAHEDYIPTKICGGSNTS
jgi:hypothetical protein